MLSKPDYGQITVLWSAVFITISTLYRPVEQLLSRHISERLTKGEPLRPADAGRLDDPVRPRAVLRRRRARAARADPGRPAGGQRNALLGLLSAVLFYAASYFARGFLAGQRSFGLFTALILSESCFRTLFAVLVAVSILSGQSAVAVGIVAAPP